MKDFILKAGDSSISFSAIIMMFLVIVASLLLCSYYSVLYGILFFVMGLGILIEFFYFLFVVVDIREQLKTISDNTRICYEKMTLLK